MKLEKIHMVVFFLKDYSTVSSLSALSLNLAELSVFLK